MTYTRFDQVCPPVGTIRQHWISDREVRFNFVGHGPERLAKIETAIGYDPNTAIELVLENRETQVQRHVIHYLTTHLPCRVEAVR